ncbi:MAG: glyoxylate/hydroxypyruvate reductase [Acetobacteraceae bacterium]|nr:glyoxylate/hydroxypyruvate reductase [Acetobacteraceae bacterium]
MTKPRGLLLVKSGGDGAVPEWQAGFREFAPELLVRGWNDTSVDPGEVNYVLVWEPEPGRIAGYRNLRVICSSAAGVEHIVRDPTLPPHLPILRMVSQETSQTLGEYVCLAALSILRDFPRMIAAQAERRWDPYEPPHTALDKRVGIMGIGTIGQVAARMLGGLGFKLSGWARTRKSIDGVTMFSGDDELASFLSGCDILVNLLPDTPETRGILDVRRLAQLPHGAGVVNAGRGTAIILPDLVAALDSGQIGAAVLDVFEQEPLPAESPIWRHPNVTVTAHLAGYASRRARAAAVVAALEALERGETVRHLYDRVRGY